MSIYGDQLILGSKRNPSILENYLDNSFLESILNEASVNIEKEINSLKDKEKITEKDIKEICKKIGDIEDKKAKVRLNRGLINVMIGLLGSYVSMIITMSGDVNFGLPISVGSLILSLVGSRDLDKQEIDQFYYKLMKIEAQARKNKAKAEKLDDGDERVKELDKVINICEELKKKRKEILASNSKEDLKESTVYESSNYLLEYKGNDIKNDIFIQVLDDVDDICKMNMDKISAYEDAVSKMMTLGRNSNEKSIKDNLVKAREIGRKTGEDLNKIKSYYGPLTFNLIKSEVKKFNNKYSSVTMGEKKKLAEKLNAYKKKLIEIGKNYEENSTLEKDWTKILDKLETYDVAARKEFLDLVNSWMVGIINEVNWTINDIDTVLKLMNIEKTEKSIIYKVMNLKSSKNK